jgi:hypothetical protein
MQVAYCRARTGPCTPISKVLIRLGRADVIAVLESWLGKARLEYPPSALKHAVAKGCHGLDMVRWLFARVPSQATGDLENTAFPFPQCARRADGAACAAAAVVHSAQFDSLLSWINLTGFASALLLCEQRQKCTYKHTHHTPRRNRSGVRRNGRWGKRWGKRWGR